MVVAAIHETIAYDPVVREFWDGGLTGFVERMRATLVEEQRAGRAHTTDACRFYAERHCRV